jgi:vancomycin resistance protein YoaR
MKKNKKILIISLVAVAVLAITFGAVAIAHAADQGTSPPQSANLTLYNKVAADYKTNTGTAIDPAALQKAFQQAEKELATEARDAALQKMVAAGKITQKQADDYKNWLNSQPANALTDAYKAWLQSKPQGIPGGPGMGAPAMPRDFGGMGKMFRR